MITEISQFFQLVLLFIHSLSKKIECFFLASSLQKAGSVHYFLPIANCASDHQMRLTIAVKIH